MPGVKGSVGSDDIGRIRVLERDTETGEADALQKVAVETGTLDHRRDTLLCRKLIPDLRIHRAGIDPHAERTVVLHGNIDQKADFLLPAAVSFMVVEVSRVVSNLVNKRGDRFSQSIVLLQINREVGLGVCPDFSQSLCIFVTVSRNADNASSGRSQLVDLSAGGLHIPGVGGAHALDDNRISTTNGEISDPDRSGHFASGKRVGLCAGHLWSGGISRCLEFGR